MSLLLVSACHRTATGEVLEALNRRSATGRTLLERVADLPEVQAAALLSTCNRVELYCAVTDVDRASTAVRRLVRGHAGGCVQDGLRVHRGRDAVRHLFRVACGLESMAVGETEILGQVRTVLRELQARREPSAELDHAFQHAVHVARLVHARTELSGLSRSLIGAALQHAREVLGDLTGRPALLVGAGSYARLVARALRTADVGQITVANRTPGQALRLADSVGGRAVGLHAVPSELERVDLAVFCTGAPGLLLSATEARRACERRSGAALVLADLAVPRDVAPQVAGLPGVHLIDLPALGARLAEDRPPGRTAPADALVDSEVDAYLGQRQAQAAILDLQSTTQQVVDAELARLRRRIPDLDTSSQSEMAHALHRLSRKLLHPQIADLRRTAAHDQARKRPASVAAAGTERPGRSPGSSGSRGSASSGICDARSSAPPPAAAA